MSDRTSKPFFDRSRGKSFVYDAGSDTYLYEDGTRTPRPSNVDPSIFNSAAPRYSGDVALPQPSSTRDAGRSLRATPQGGRNGNRTAEPTRSPSMVTAQSPPNRASASYTYRPQAPANPPTLPLLAPRRQIVSSDRSSRQPASGNVETQFGQLNIEDTTGVTAQTQYRSQGPSQEIPRYNAQQADPRTDPRRSRATSITGQSQPLQRQNETPSQDSQSLAEEAARQMVFQPRQYEEGDLRLWETHNEQNDVRLTLAPRALNPSVRITDPALFRSGIRAQGLLLGSGREGDGERLYSSFKVRSHRFFVVGRVFLVLWVEPAGTTAVLNLERNDVFPGRYQDEFIYSKVRRFVVVREGKDYCSALPIVSYGHRGVGKPGVKKSEHAIIYTGTEPAPLPSEQPQRGELSMRTNAIKVVPDDPTDKLDPESRLDLGKVHTVQHNIKVKPFGQVHPSCKVALTTQFINAWHGEAVASGITSQEAAGSAAQPPGRSKRMSVGSGIYQTREEQPPQNVPIRPVGPPSTQRNAAGVSSQQAMPQYGSSPASRESVFRTTTSTGNSGSGDRTWSGQTSVPFGSRAAGKAQATSSNNDSSSEESSDGDETQQEGAQPRREPRAVPLQTSAGRPPASRQPQARAEGRTSSNQSSSSIAEAANARRAYQRMREQGVSQIEAVQRMIGSLMSSSPGLSWDAAAAQIRSHLSS